MDIVFTSLILLLAVALSGVLMGLLPVALPKPLVQIAIGAALALPGFGLHITLEPELFFLLFIPPLLFADGWRMPRREFRKLGVPIAALALGLVMVTVVLVGYFVHWMIPAIPLSAGFALGAVLSPTDAVAVSAISGSTPIPGRLLHILQGEALMNDASGLVALRFAIAAALTGSFSLPQAALSFCLIAAGGLAVGVALAWVFSWIRGYLTRWRGDDPTSHVALLMLIPFAAYLLGEQLGVSGILSAVAAGMTLNSVNTLKGELATRMQTNSMWSMLEFVFNGIVFLLLGLQMPKILGHAQQSMNEIGGGGFWHLGLFIAAIMGVLLVTRYLWIWVLLRLMVLRARYKGEIVPRLSTRVITITTLAGVRGAITLAAVLSLPLAVEDGSTFPARGVLVFIAAGVILLSLTIGSVGLPPLLRSVKMPDGDPRAREERDARVLAARAALKALEAEQKQQTKDSDDPESSLYAEVGARVIAGYKPRLDPDNDGEESQRMRRGFDIEKQLRLTALRAERDELYRLRHSFRINDETLRRIVADIDLTEASLLGSSARRRH
ncbi:Na+/H+ antiporter [Salinisphaera aquimarina]|uniref:Na+/H+ antiporter n=1 Tax=Salinisphaera aquimarina TaxID=2094031 RepID=A0ABV7ET58_9GAMM